jgi:hypothetical protein
MTTVASFRKKVLEFKKLNDTLGNTVIEMSIDDKLDTSNFLKSKLDNLNKSGKKLYQAGCSIANNVQFLSEEDVDIVLNTRDLLNFVSLLSHFLVQQIMKDSVLSKSLKKDLTAFSTTISCIDETIMDINSELELLVDADFQSLMKNIQQQLT